MMDYDRDLLPVRENASTYSWASLSDFGNEMVGVSPSPIPPCNPRRTYICRAAWDGNAADGASTINDTNRD